MAPQGPPIDRSTLADRVDTGAAALPQDSPNKSGGMPQAQGNLTTIA